MHLRPWLLPALSNLILVSILIAANPVRAAGEDATQPTPSALSTDPSGWEDIMPAPDLKGWLDVPLHSKLTRQQWHVVNGQLVCDGDGGKDVLLLDRKVRNCIFHVEYCLTKIEGQKDKSYNSGVFIRTSRDAAIWHQAQVGSLFGGYWFGVTPNGGGGTTRFNVPSLPCRVKEAGEWNTYELTVQGRNLLLWVNGYPCAPFHDCGLDEGYLGVQGEGSLITFRNLKLKVLP
jgi:hypothetical protein